MNVVMAPVALSTIVKDGFAGPGVPSWQVTQPELSNSGWIAPSHGTPTTAAWVKVFERRWLRGTSRSQPFPP